MRLPAAGTGRVMVTFSVGVRTTLPPGGRTVPSPFGTIAPAVAAVSMSSVRSCGESAAKIKSRACLITARLTLPVSTSSAFVPERSTTESFAATIIRPLASAGWPGKTSVVSTRLKPRSSVAGWPVVTTIGTTTAARLLKITSLPASPVITSEPLRNITPRLPPA